MGAFPRRGGSGASPAAPSAAARQPARAWPRCGAWEDEQLKLQTWAPALGKEGGKKKKGSRSRTNLARRTAAGGWGGLGAPKPHPPGAGGSLRTQQSHKKGMGQLCFPPASVSPTQPPPGQGQGCTIGTERRRSNSPPSAQRVKPPSETQLGPRGTAHPTGPHRSRLDWSRSQGTGTEPTVATSNTVGRVQPHQDITPSPPAPKAADAPALSSGPQMGTHARNGGTEQGMGGMSPL